MSSLRTMRLLLLKSGPSDQHAITLNEGQGDTCLLMNSVQPQCLSPGNNDESLPPACFWGLD